MSNRHGSKSKQSATATASPPEPMSMKQWTVGAIDSLISRSDGGKDKIVCSREYLSCALKIAHSLANQLSTVEEERGYKEKSPSHHNINNTNSPPMIETLDKSWSEYIYVYCMTKTKAIQEEKKNEISMHNDASNNESDKGHTSVDADFEPLLYNNNNNNNSDNSDPSELQNLAQQLSSLLENDDNKKKSVDYLDVRGAILNEGAVHGRPLSDNGKLEIRTLGIAFYELFSGGYFTAGARALGHHTAAASSDESAVNAAIMESIDAIAIGVGGDDQLLDNNPTKRRSLQHSNTNLYNLSQKTAIRTPSTASISVEPLKLLGLPTALCDLISNMIDSVIGSHGGIGEAYEFVSEVRDDLKLMIDCPNLYLQDVDLAKATNVGLQFGRSLYGREAELQTLKECFQRSISNECEVAMICGTSGIGKSKLSQEFARSVTEDGGSIFLSGRFDKLESQPLRAISSAFDKYCAWVTVGDQAMAEKVSTALKENIGQEIACLVTAMPNLANILGDDFNFSQSNNNDTAVDAQKRLRYLFCQFVDIISRCHEEPLILFLDDCQWIDSASVAILNQILIMSGSAIKNHRFFFFGACRDDEMSESHPLNFMLTTVNTFGTKTTKIQLSSMSKGAVNKMVSTELSLLPRITRSLANILHHKTKGSPLFVKQVMMELYKQRLLYPSLSHRRWVWETNKILDMKIPENVATFITNSFDRLPSEVLSALVVLSCFGASADISLIEVLEREIGQPLISPLDDAVAHSVLGKRNGEFYFMHDKLQEAAYSKMKPEERCLHHNRYGLALGFVAARERDDRLLLTGVAQINHGGPKAIIDEEQAVVVANLNLDAGKKAMNMSDFFSAHSFFDHGISNLRRGHWNDYYDLSLELFNLAAKCALMNAEHDGLKMLTNQIMHNAKCLEDKFQAISITVTLLNWSGNVPAAVDLINNTLSSLDEELPSAVTPLVIKQYLDKTKTKLAIISDDILLSYPAMINPSKILAVEFLVKLYGSLTLIGERAAIPIIPLKVIQISLTYGMSPHSPSAFAQYGSYLALIGGEFEEGYRYAKFALSLMKTIPTRAHDGNIMFHSNLTKLYVEPAQSSIECYLDSCKVAMKSGNPYAVVSSLVHSTLCLWSGKELNVAVVAMKDTMKESKYHKNVVVLALMRPTFRIALRLMGQSDAPHQDNLPNAFGETFKEDNITEKYAAHLHTIMFAKLSESLIFREFNEARDAADKYFSVDRFASLTPLMFFKRL
eukprot:scaffold3085_cov127-Skeletonema_marinoi.AAC.2